MPPLLASGAVGESLRQVRQFRIRRISVDLPTLPAELDGITIAHITDVHTGRFTFGQKLVQVADTVNELDADLIAMTGDLIDYRIADLVPATEMLKRIEHPERIFMCEGNHDLFEDRHEFEGQMRDFAREYGMSMLINEWRMFRIRGHNLQIMGLRWGHGHPKLGAQLDDNMPQLLRERRPDAWHILLAHHPHAFDDAAEAGIPLTLSGHTHGGQLMLTPNIGAGPLLFRYWSGLYEKNDSRLVVSNGVGNWFPLRINAPAEILHLTLRRTKA